MSAFASLFLFAAAAAAPHWPAPACFWVTGRLFVAEGTPSIRLQPHGTRRLLGVLSKTGEAEGGAVLPPDIARLSPSFDRALWGRFHVCPMAPERAGAMRMVTIDRARSVVVQR